MGKILEKSVIPSLVKLFEGFRSKAIVRDSLKTTFFSILSRSLGLIIPFFIAAWYGVGSETDAFFFAYGAIFFISILFSSLVRVTVVPFVVEAQAKQGDLGKLLGSLLMGSILFMASIAVVFAFSAYPLFRAVTGFNPQQTWLAYILSLEAIPLTVLVVWGSLMEGTLNALRYFVHPQFSVGLRSLVTIICIFLFHGFLGIHAIPLAYVLGELCRDLQLSVCLLRVESISLKFCFPDREAIDFFKKSSIQLIGTITGYFVPFIDRIMASWTGVGSVSLLEYSLRLFYIPVVLLGDSLLVVLLSYWSSAASHDIKKFKTSVLTTLRWGLAVSIPLAAAAVYVAPHVTSLVYGRGSFPADKVGDVSNILILLILGFPAHMAKSFFNTSLFALKGTLSLAFAGVFYAFCKITLNLLLIPGWGIQGIALASTFSECLAALALWWSFMRAVKVRTGISGE